MPAATLEDTNCPDESTSESVVATFGSGSPSFSGSGIRSNADSTNLDTNIHGRQELMLILV